MSTPHPLDILFLTNFSEYCYRSIPAIAQMADALKVRLTIMHVYHPGKRGRTEAEAQIRSFFPEADRYAACNRCAVPGPMLQAVQRHLEVWPVNLIVAPASDPIGLPRIGDRSLRGRLIEECGIPVWTIARHTQQAKLTHPMKNVACWLDFHSHQTGHLAFAMEYANKLNAELHVIHALPEIHDGSVVWALDPNVALHPSAATQKILDLCRTAPVTPVVHVSTGSGRSTLARMLRECNADVVFLRGEESLLSKWLGLGLRLGDGIPCPAIYVGDEINIPMWNLEPGGAHRVAEAGRPQVTTSTPRNGSRTVSWAAELGLR